MLTTLLVSAVAILLLFELLEHVILPLLARGKGPPRPVSGPERMIGRSVVVRTWHGGAGLVAIGGELWRGVCEAPLGPGDEAVVRAVRGLTLELEVAAGGSPTGPDAAGPPGAEPAAEIPPGGAPTPGR